MDYYECMSVDKLPDLVMYGGSSDRMEVAPLDPGGARIDHEYAASCTAKMTLSPLSAISGLGNNGTPVTPVLIKTGSVEDDEGGDPVFVFYLTEDDTKKLRGKYIYQVEIRSGDSVYLCQGRLYILMNNNQEG